VILEWSRVIFFNRVIAPGARPVRAARSALPARSVDVVAFLATERRRGLSVTTVELRRAAIRTLHFICGCAVPTAEAQVSETMTGMHRIAAASGRLSARKLAAIRVAHLAPCGHGLRLTRPHTKGERHRQGRQDRHPLRHPLSDHRPARLAGRSRDRRGGSVPEDLDLAARQGRPQYPLPRVGAMAIDAGTVTRIIQTRAARAGFEAKRLSDVSAWKTARIHGFPVPGGQAERRSSRRCGCPDPFDMRADFRRHCG
jgi:hypothetical protein